MRQAAATRMTRALCVQLALSYAAALVAKLKHAHFHTLTRLNYEH